MRSWRFLGAILLAASALADDPPYDIRKHRRELSEAYGRESAALEEAVHQGGITRAEAQARLEQLNRQRFAEARRRGAEFETRLEELLVDARAERAREAAAYNSRTGRGGSLTPEELQRRAPDPGWVEPGNTGTPLSDPKSRGIFGDQDLTFASDADRAAFVRAARKRKYTVGGRIGEGYITIKELDIVAHGPTPIPRQPLDPASLLQTAERAGGHESFASRGARGDYIPRERNEWSARDELGRVADNTKKVEGDLRLDPSLLDDQEKLEAWAQNLAKGTGRAMDAVGKTEEKLAKAIAEARAAGKPASEIAELVRELEFRKQLAVLKTGMDPRVAGVLPVATGTTERGRLLKLFQDRCLLKFHEAYVQGSIANAGLVADMNLRIAQLRAAGDVAGAELVVAERARILDADAQALQYLATHPKDGGRLLAEIVSGGRLERVVVGGQVHYRDGTGRLLSEAEALGIARRAVEEVRTPLRARPPREVVPDVVGPGGPSRLERGLTFLAAIASGLEGARKELDDARRQGRHPSRLLATLKGWADFTCIPLVYETSVEISRDQMRREIADIEEMVQRGEQPNLIYIRIEHLLVTLTRVVGALTGASNIVELGDEYVGILQAELQRASANPDEIVRARAPALIAAVEHSLADLARMQAEITKETAAGRERVEPMRQAAQDLFVAEARLESSGENTAEIARLCAETRGQRRYVETLVGPFAELAATAHSAAGELEAIVQAACAAAQGGAPAAAERHLAAVRESAPEAARSVVLATGAWEELEREARELGEKDARLRHLLATTRPSDLLAAAPVYLERIRSAGEQAALPLERALMLGLRTEALRRGLEFRIELLLDARAEVGRARGLGEEIARVQTRIDSETFRGLAQEINGTVERGYDRYEAIETLRLRTDEDAWLAACPDPVAPFDTTPLEERARGLSALHATREAARARAEACVTGVRPALRVARAWTTSDREGQQPRTAFAPGETFYLQVDVELEQVFEAGTLHVRAVVSRPDGGSVELGEQTLGLEAGRRAYRSASPLHFLLGTGPGTYTAEAYAVLGPWESPRVLAGFECSPVGFSVGPVLATLAPESDVPVARFARGQAVQLQVGVDLDGLAAPANLHAHWTVVGPDGAERILASEGLRVEPGGSGVRQVLRSALHTDASSIAGAYAARCAVSFQGETRQAAPAAFEVGALLEDLEIALSAVPASAEPLDRFRPGDLLAVRVRYRYNGASATELRLRLACFGPAGELPGSGVEWTEPAGDGGGSSNRNLRLPEVLAEGTCTLSGWISCAGADSIQAQRSFEIVHPIRFDGTWLFDPAVPEVAKERYRAGDVQRRLVRYRLQELRPGDAYSSWFECWREGRLLPALGSREFPPQAAEAGEAHTFEDHTLGADLGEGAYELRPVVRVAGARYQGAPAWFVIERGTEIVIASPQTGFHVREKVLQLAGTCSDPGIAQGTLVTNGQAVPLRIENGRFAARTVLRPGENRIQVGVRSASGDVWAETRGTADIPAAMLKLVLAWEAATTDIDLWVTDPQGVKTNWHTKRPQSDRNLDIDDTSGPGQETYTMESQLRGRYLVAVHYYSAGSHLGAVPIQLHISRWEATQWESHETRSGALQHSAGDRDEAGAVVTFEVDL